MPGLGARESLDAIRRQRDADSRMSDARPRQPWADAIAAVPVHRAGADLREDFSGALRIGRVDARGQPVFGVVHERDGLGVAGDFLNADDWAEALVLHDAHAVIDVDEDGRLEPVALALDDVASN